MKKFIIYLVIYTHLFCATSAIAGPTLIEEDSFDSSSLASSSVKQMPSRALIPHQDLWISARDENVYNLTWASSILQSQQMNFSLRDEDHLLGQIFVRGNTVLFSGGNVGTTFVLHTPLALDSLMIETQGAFIFKKPVALGRASHVQAKQVQLLDAWSSYETLSFETSGSFSAKKTLAAERLAVRSEGDITVKGPTCGSSSLELISRAGDVRSEKSLLSVGTLKIEGKDVILRGSINSVADDLFITATQDIDSQAQIRSGGRTMITSDEMNHEGSLTSDDAVTVQVKRVELKSGSTMVSKGPLVLEGDVVRNRGQISTKDLIWLKTSTLYNHPGASVIARNGVFKGNQLDTAGHLSFKEGFSFEGKTFKNSGRFEASQGTFHGFEQFDNTASGSMRVEDSLSLKGEKFKNHKLSSPRSLKDPRHFYAGFLDMNVRDLYDFGMTEVPIFALIQAGSAEFRGSFYCGYGSINTSYHLKIPAEASFEVFRHLSLNARSALEFYGSINLRAQNTERERLLSDGLKKNQSLAKAIKQMPHEVIMVGGAQFMHRGKVSSSHTPIRYKTGGTFTFDGRSQSGYFDSNATTVQALQASLQGQMTSHSLFGITTREDFSTTGVLRASTLQMNVVRNLQMGGTTHSTYLMAQSGGDIRLSGSHTVEKSGQITAGKSLKAEGSLKAGESLALRAKDMEFLGMIEAGETLQLMADQDIWACRGSSLLGKNMQIKSGRAFVNSGTLRAAENLSARGRYIVNFGYIGAQNAQMNADFLFFNGFGGTINTESLSVNAGVSINLLGLLHARNSMTINSLVDLNLGGIRSAFSLSTNSLLSFNAGLNLPSLPTWKYFTSPQNLVGGALSIARMVDPTGIARLANFAWSGYNMVQQGRRLYGQYQQGGFGEYSLSDWIGVAMDIKGLAMSAKGLYDSKSHLFDTLEDPKTLWSKIEGDAWYSKIGTLAVDAFGPRINTDTLLAVDIGANLSGTVYQRGLYGYNHGFIGALGGYSLDLACGGVGGGRILASRINVTAGKYDFNGKAKARSFNLTTRQTANINGEVRGKRVALKGRDGSIRGQVFAQDLRGDFSGRFAASGVVESSVINIKAQRGSFSGGLKTHAFMGEFEDVDMAGDVDELETSTLRGKRYFVLKSQKGNLGGNLRGNGYQFDVAGHADVTWNVQGVDGLSLNAGSANLNGRYADSSNLYLNAGQGGDVGFTSEDVTNLALQGQHLHFLDPEKIGGVGITIDSGVYDEGAEGALILAQRIGADAVTIHASGYDLKTAKGFGFSKTRHLHFRNIENRGTIWSDAGLMLEADGDCITYGDINAKGFLTTIARDGKNVTSDGAVLRSETGDVTVRGGAGVEISSVVDPKSHVARVAGIHAQNGILISSGGDLNTLAVQLHAGQDALMFDVAGDVYDHALSLDRRNVSRILRTDGHFEGTPGAPRASVGYVTSEFLGETLHAQVNGKFTTEAGQFVFTKGGYIRAVNGIDVKGMAHTYVSDSGSRSKGPWGIWGKETWSKESTDFYVSRFLSSEGGFTLSAPEGGIRFNGTQFLTEGTNQVLAKEGIHLGALRSTEHHESSDSSWFHINSSRHKGSEEVASVTQMIGLDSLVLLSETKKVTGEGALIYARNGGSIRGAEGFELGTLALRYASEDQSRKLYLDQSFKDGVHHPILRAINGLRNPQDGVTGLCTDFIGLSTGVANLASRIIKNVAMDGISGFGSVLSSELGLTRIGVGMELVDETRRGHRLQFGSLAGGAFEFGAGEGASVDLRGTNIDLQGAIFDTDRVLMGGGLEHSEYSKSHQRHGISFDALSCAAGSPTLGLGVTSGMSGHREERNTTKYGTVNIHHLHFKRSAQVVLEDGRANIGTVTGKDYTLHTISTPDIIRRTGYHGNLGGGLGSEPGTSAALKDVGMGGYDITDFVTSRRSFWSQGSGVNPLTRKVTYAEDRTEGGALGFNYVASLDEDVFAAPLSISGQIGSSRFRATPYIGFRIQNLPSYRSVPLDMNAVDGDEHDLHPEEKPHDHDDDLPPMTGAVAAMAAMDDLLEKERRTVTERNPLRFIEELRDQPLDPKKLMLAMLPYTLASGTLSFGARLFGSVLGGGEAVLMPSLAIETATVTGLVTAAAITSDGKGGEASFRENREEKTPPKSQDRSSGKPNTPANDNRGPQGTIHGRSDSTWTGQDGSSRLDFEAPMGREGNIHLQRKGFEKVYYDPKTRDFPGLSNREWKQLQKDHRFMRGLEKALKAVGWE